MASWKATIPLAELIESLLKNVPDNATRREIWGDIIDDTEDRRAYDGYLEEDPMFDEVFSEKFPEEEDETILDEE